MGEDLLAEAGPELGGHLKDVLKKMITENPGTGYHAFEIISRCLKTNPAGKNVKLYDSTLSEEEVAARASHVEKVSKLTNDPADDDGNALGICALPNFVAQNEIFKNAGFGFSDGEANGIMNALRHFAATNEDGLKKLRFWGKILGSQKDYYVAEGQLDGGGEGDEEDKLFEPMGTGCNTFVYWVCSDMNNPVWTRLPDAKPKFIVASTQLRRVLTGNLDATVTTYPHFSGTEADLLRSTIARITAGTVLNVKGYLKRDEDSGEITENVDDEGRYTWPSLEQLSSVNGWCHCTDYIMRWGRCSYLDISEEDEENRDLFELQEEIKREDPMPEEPVLRDAQSSSWSARLHSRNTVGVRSSEWPGAVCVYQDKEFANLYVGYGNPRTLHPYYAGTDFYLAPPPMIQSEPVDGEEHAEPTPADGPPAPPAEEEEAG